LVLILRGLDIWFLSSYEMILKAETKLIGAVRAENGLALWPVNSAVERILARPNAQSAPPDPSLSTREQNNVIRARYAAGVSQAELARQFGISYSACTRLCMASGSEASVTDNHRTPRIA
jgi:hypothetical protein